MPMPGHCHHAGNHSLVEERKAVPGLFFDISVNFKHTMRRGLKWRSLGDSNPCYRRERAVS